MDRSFATYYEYAYSYHYWYGNGCVGLPCALFRYSCTWHIIGQHISSSDPASYQYWY